MSKVVRQFASKWNCDNNDHNNVMWEYSGISSYQISSFHIKKYIFPQPLDDLKYITEWWDAQKKKSVHVCIYFSFLSLWKCVKPILTMMYACNQF